MNYQSTRSKIVKISPSEAVIRGIADDGGLYLFENIGDIRLDYKPLIGKSTFEIAVAVLSKLLDDFSKEEMQELVFKAYSRKFETDELTPLVRVGDRYVLELFRGPTSAFKDVALSMLPQLLTAACEKHNINDEIVILTATSGDTGKAALAGFCNVPGTRIIVFYPENGVSKVQKAQMVTQVGENVSVCAVRGNFDDAQTGVKNIFATVAAENLLDGSNVRLSSANSINIGRLAPQVVYYFKAYFDLIENGRICDGDLVNFCVPTGNFGDILAGYLAKLMGLPVGKLICASNANDVLTEFFKTGVYDRCRPFYKTVSPSMDILISSNLERLLYLESGCDTEFVSSLMNQLNSEGKYAVDDEFLALLQKDFSAGCCNDTETEATIADVWKKYGYLCDTHTAVAWKVADNYLSKNTDTAPMVVLSTASPYKFPASVARACEISCSDNEFEVMQDLCKATNIPVPAGLSGLENAKVLHTDIVDRDKMLEYVLDKVNQ